MSSIYARGNRLWGRIKDERGKWISRRTEFFVGQEDEARREIAAAQRIKDRKRSTTSGVLTVEAWASKWLEVRKTRELASIADDIGRLNNHVLPLIGHLPMEAVETFHMRDMVRELVKEPDLAPRTVRNCYGIARTMFHDAMVERVIRSNPCVLSRGELPAKVDKDPEWRSAAMFTRDEVKLLTTSELLPIERRIQYALKALAGLRHGEVAGLRWRHYDVDTEPLGRLTIATSYDRGRTKTGRPRYVPVHPTLAKALAAWRAKGWREIYGRKPTIDDLVVPTRNQTPVEASDAVHAFKADLGKLELRIDAGKHRDRGGHDLRGWFITTAQEHGAHRDLLRIVTHPGKGDVVGGYTRASWPALCAEVSKLRAFRGRS